jgi:hypothetical protein
MNTINSINSINSMNTIRDRDKEGFLRIRGTGFGCVYVHLHEIGYGESRADMAWTEEFAIQLHKRLQRNFGFTGDVRVTDSMKHSDGNWFTGDVPDSWDSEDLLAVTNAMFRQI